MMWRSSNFALRATSSSQRCLVSASSALITSIRVSWASHALVMAFRPRVSTVCEDGLNSDDSIVRLVGGYLSQALNALAS